MSAAVDPSPASERRLGSILDRLQQFYGLLPEPPSDAFRLFVWEALGARSTAQRQELAFNALKRLRALTPDALVRAPQAKLESAVALAGSHREQRLTALRTGAELFRRSPAITAGLRRRLADARRSLRKLPQPGPAVAHRLLLFAGNHPIMPLDADELRAGLRIGLGSPAGGLRQSSRMLRQAIELESANELDMLKRAAVYLSHHGAATCVERDPHCQICPLAGDCKARSAGAVRPAPTTGVN